MPLTVAKMFMLMAEVLYDMSEWCKRMATK